MGFANKRNQLAQVLDLVLRRTKPNAAFGAWFSVSGARVWGARSADEANANVWCKV